MAPMGGTPPSRQGHEVPRRRLVVAGGETSKRAGRGPDSRKLLTDLFAESGADQLNRRPSRQSPGAQLSLSANPKHLTCTGSRMMVLHT